MESSRSGRRGCKGTRGRHTGRRLPLEAHGQPALARLTGTSEVPTAWCARNGSKRLRSGSFLLIVLNAPPSASFARSGAGFLLRHALLVNCRS